MRSSALCSGIARVDPHRSVKLEGVASAEAVCSRTFRQVATPDGHFLTLWAECLIAVGRYPLGEPS
ncbi:hypothetical protein PUN4_10029 [Paraburkholderia unamae]|nr:hypothetical protein PUN4_10029 [Paraburkholderia unamae]